MPTSDQFGRRSIPLVEKINRQPRGYLDLLGIKSLGHNPARVPVELQPGFGVDDLLMHDLVQTKRVSVTWAGTGYGTPSETVIVPQGQAWRLLSWSVSASAIGGGGTAGRIRPQIVNGSFIDWEFNDTALSATFRSAAAVNLGFWTGIPLLRSGQQPTVECIYLDAGSFTGFWALQYIPLTI